MSRPNSKQTELMFWLFVSGRLFSLGFILPDMTSNLPFSLLTNNNLMRRFIVHDLALFCFLHPTNPTSSPRLSKELRLLLCQGGGGLLTILHTLQNFSQSFSILKEKKNLFSKSLHLHMTLAHQLSLT